MSQAWIYQDDKQVKKRGEEAASWYVGWYDPDGKKKCKSCGPGVRGQRAAEKKRQQIEAQLLTGTYHEQVKTTWETFRKEYEEKVLTGLAPRTRGSVKASLDAFERHVKPGKVCSIGTAVIDDFIARRRSDRGVKKGMAISPHSINHDLRHIKAALAVAKEWGYLPAVPKIRMVKAVKKLPTFVDGAHFAAIYAACDTARFPADLPYPSGDFWRALLVTGYMTGWRIGDMIGLTRMDLDLDEGYAITRGDDNKGKRDERVKLHPVVVEHLKKIPSFDSHVFPWNHDVRTLHTIFAEIQEAAKICLPCQDRRPHEHTRFCHVYGFHDLRRAFATMNAAKLTPDALQKLMRHKSYQTTQVYIEMTSQMDAAVAGLHVPEVLQAREAK